MRRENFFFRYFIISLISIFAFCFILNILIDPLWYFKGNKINKINYSWDERSQLLNRFFKLSETQHFDCFVFGSSTSTVINVKKIKNYNCYNFSFSGGQLSEYYILLKYLKKRINPKIIFIEVNFGLPNFDIKKNNLPDYVNLNEDNKNFIKDYFSLKSTVFSIKTLLKKPNLLNAYDQDFAPYILDISENYRSKLSENIIFQNFSKKKIFASNIKIYEDLRNDFHKAKFIGYVNPFHPYKTLKYKYHNKLDDYLETIFEISKLFDHFYDFSIPSELTKNNYNTYDGAHYYEHVYDKFIEIVFNKNLLNYNFGIKVTNEKNYINKYNFEVNKFVEELLKKSRLFIELSKKNNAFGY